VSVSSDSSPELIEPFGGPDEEDPDLHPDPTADDPPWADYADEDESRTTRAAPRSRSRHVPRVLRCVSEGLVEQIQSGGSSPGTWESRRPQVAWLRSP
jgi:hypothetical protein